MRTRLACAVLHTRVTGSGWCLRGSAWQAAARTEYLMVAVSSAAVARPAHPALECGMGCPTGSGGMLPKG